MQISFTPLPSIVAFGLGVVIVGLGSYISWRAFQGYRRNDSRRMALLAIGMVFITVIPTLIELILIPFVGRFFRATGPAIEFTIIGSRTSEAIGILILIYSIRVRN